MYYKIATGIETAVWRNIVLGLYREGWRVLEKYQSYDAGVDFDFIILEKDKVEILLGWDFIDDGEIKAQEETFKYLEEKFNICFEYGQPKCLTIKIIALTRLSTLPRRFARSTQVFFKDQFGVK